MGEQFPRLIDGDYAKITAKSIYGIIGGLL